MPKDKDENGDGGKTENKLEQAVEMLAQTMALLAQNQPKKVIDESSPEYRERLIAEGFMDDFGGKVVIQNGHESQARGLSADVRHRAANLRSGSYLGGKVTVEADEKVVHIRYKSATVEQRMAQTWKSFDELVNLIWSEMHVAT